MGQSLDKNAVQQAELDLLAEGELTGPERDELMARMDRHPDAWRRCALTLLETRLLAEAIAGPASRELGEQKITPTATSLPTGTVKKVTTRHSWNQTAWQAIAATVLVAVGIWAGQVWQTIQVAALPPRADHSPRETQPSEGHILDRARVTENDIQRARMETLLALDDLQVQDAKIVAMVNVSNETVSDLVPLVVSSELQKHWLHHRPAKPQPDFIKNANRLGWDVTQQRQLLSVQIPNQPSQIVPIDWLNYRFVGLPID